MPRPQDACSGGLPSPVGFSWRPGWSGRPTGQRAFERRRGTRDRPRPPRPAPRPHYAVKGFRVVSVVDVQIRDDKGVRGSGPTATCMRIGELP